jgi:hypothetical protein
LIDDPEQLAIEYLEFLNFFPQRAPRMMWLLGAGASVTSGLPTAGTLIWDFKRQIYCNANRVPPSRFPDLENPAFRTEVQAYFDPQPGTPGLGTNEEYSFYFDRYLPEESDRHRYLKERLRGSQPSHGHLCLAALMAISKTRIVWTTNFDSLIERGYQTLQGKKSDIHDLTLVDLANTEVLSHCVANEDWPLLVKLHGDYKYKKLKNTTEELRLQDTTLRGLLVRQCKQWGLSVVGYSGRDSSVMEALMAATEEQPCYPQGLYWFIRSGTKPDTSVIQLVKRIREVGSPAAIIEVGGFDELMEDLFLPHQDQLPIARDLVKTSRPRRRALESNYGRGAGFPLIRTNALEVTGYPATCTVFQCKIGGAKEVSELTTRHRSRVTAARRKEGVIAFGTKKDLIAIFNDKEPERFDVLPIESRRFYYESHEVGMFYDAVCQGVANATGLLRLASRKGRTLYFPNGFEMPAELKGQLGPLGNSKTVIPPQGSEPYFHQAVTISLDYRDARLWCILEPTVVLTADGEQLYQATGKAALIKDHLSGRFNSKANQWLEFWIKVLTFHHGTPIKINFPDDDNPEAEFTLSEHSAWSRPQ